MIVMALNLWLKLSQYSANWPTVREICSCRLSRAPFGSEVVFFCILYCAHAPENVNKSSGCASRSVQDNRALLLRATRVENLQILSAYRLRHRNRCYQL